MHFAWEHTEQDRKIISYQCNQLILLHVDIFHNHIALKQFLFLANVTNLDIHKHPTVDSVKLSVNVQNICGSLQTCTLNKHV